MSTIDPSGQRTQTTRFPCVIHLAVRCSRSISWLSCCSSLLRSSGGSFSAAHGALRTLGRRPSLCLHLPTDTWEHIGTMAQFFGTGALMQALGILAKTFGVLALSAAAAGRSVVVAVVEILIAVLVAACFGISGAHALISGITCVPSPLQHMCALDVGGPSSQAGCPRCALTAQVTGGHDRLRVPDRLKLGGLFRCRLPDRTPAHRLRVA